MSSTHLYFNMKNENNNNAAIHPKSMYKEKFWAEMEERIKKSKIKSKISRFKEPSKTCLNMEARIVMKNDFFD